jgi:hypothetical protein
MSRKGFFGPGTILRRIMYDKKYRDKKLLKLVDSLPQGMRNLQALEIVKSVLQCKAGLNIRPSCLLQGGLVNKI